MYGFNADSISSRKMPYTYGKKNLPKSIIYNSLHLTLSQTSPGFYLSAIQVFRKYCGKRRNCSQRAISPFPTVFSTLLENFLLYSSNLKLSSGKLFPVGSLKFVILELVKHLNHDF